jgi:hypothetical protein
MRNFTSDEDTAEKSHQDKDRFTIASAKFRIVNCRTETLYNPAIEGPGGIQRGTASRAGARVTPLVGFFGIFLAETRKIPAGGTGTIDTHKSYIKTYRPRRGTALSIHTKAT